MTANGQMQLVNPSPQQLLQTRMNGVIGHRMTLSISLRLKLFSILAGILLLVGSVGASQASTSSSIAIESGWTFRQASKSDHAEGKDWTPATVPGGVHTDLLKAGLIPDPFYRDNEAKLQWIGLTDWEYKSTFDVSPEMLRRAHLDLVFEGLDTYADVYLNESLLLKADNMFRSWRVPAKDHLVAGANRLRVVFHSPIMWMMPRVKALPYRLPAVHQVQEVSEEGIATDPYTRKAAYNYGWDWSPRLVTEGLWKPVRLEGWDELRVQNLHIAQTRVRHEAAFLSAELEIVSGEPGRAIISIEEIQTGRKSARILRQDYDLEPGINHVSLPFRVANPRLWYPAGYGAQERYTYRATVVLGKTTEVADVHTGLRSIELRQEPDQWGRSFEFVVNGIPIFCKGADVVPFDNFPTRVTPERHRNILESARAAHMNMVRLWGGGYYESDDFYDLCDEMGILVWQDFMFGGSMVPGDREFQENVRAEVIEQVKRLRDHPSLALWVGNNEVEVGWRYWGDRLAFKQGVSSEQRERVWQDYVVLFRDIIKSAVHEYGAPTPYWPSTPTADFEAPPGNDHIGDQHYWDVWHGLAPVTDYEKQFPRFMSEYGFQSFPELRTVHAFTQPEDLDIISPVMQAHQKDRGGNEVIQTYMLREYREPKDFGSFLYMSQIVQAEAIKEGAEHFRRIRPRNMGTLYWQLNDCWPVASWSSIDYFGRWKALQYYARRFYDDLLISAVDQGNSIDAYIVSDKLQAIQAHVRIRTMDFTGHVSFEQTKDLTVPAASSVVALKIPRNLLTNGVPENRSFAVFELSVDDRVTSRNLLFFAPARELELPPTNITKQWTPTSTGGDLQLSSLQLARHVYVSFSDVEATPSDNYFDLLPGESVTLHVKTAAGSEAIRQALSIQTITDAFEPIHHQ